MRGQEPGSEQERAETDGSVAPATTPPPSFGQLLTPADEQTTAPPVPYGEGDQQETAERLPWPSAGPLNPAPGGPGAGGAPIPVYPGPPPNLPEPEPSDDVARLTSPPPSWPEAPRAATPAPRPDLPSAGHSEGPDDGQTRHWHPGHLAPPPNPITPGARDTMGHPPPPAPDTSGYPPPPAPDTNPANPLPSTPQSGPADPLPGLPQAGPSDAPPGPPHTGPADAPPGLPHSSTGPAAPLAGEGAGVQPWNVAPEPVPAADLPELPAFPGAKPWEVPSEEAEYDWFADPEPDDPQLTRTNWPKPDLPADTPPTGEPTWDPPPGFTAAAAGMQVWPSPASEPAAPPWPAATGEPIPGADYDAQEAPAPWPGTPAVPGPHPAPGPHPGPAGHADAQHPTPDPQRPNPQYPSPDAHAGHQQVPGHPGGAPGPQGQPFDPGLTSPVARPAEPGDIPVWPMKQSEDTGPHQLPELPFPPEVWGPKPALPAPRQPMALPPADSDTPPHGLPAFPGPRPPAADHPNPGGPQAPGNIQAPVSGGPVPPAGSPQAPVPVGPPNNFQPPPRQGFGNPPFAGQQGQQGQQGQTQPGSLFTPGGPTAPPQPGHPGPQPPAKGRKVLLAALGVLVLAGVSTGAFFAYRSMNSSQPADASASQPPATTQPSVPQLTDPPDDQSGASVLNSEQTDPKKLAITEAFPAKKIKIDGRSFTRVKTSLAEKCEKAASGPFADALRTQDCSRVLRATYVDSKRRYAVTTGLAVLPTKEAAVEADQAKNLSRNLWFRALPGSAGSGGDRIHIAGGYAAGLVWGRYIVFSYATYADGHTPTDKETGLGKISGGFRDQTAKVLERRIAAS
ncbi:hypothetical protein ACIBEJ_17305 [Nonomuraea sp. NPDC050790]|uniref:hypothetical protein n=1 Tax=Nonomuraea sp. NPDC050790 TaxID=3364371 RepID=UPI0037A850C3